MKSVLIQENDRDRYSKTAQIAIGQKKVLTPNFCLRIRTSEELHAYINLRRQISLPYASTCIFKYHDTPKTICSLLEGNLCSTIISPAMKAIDISIQEFLKQVPIIIDPATDSLYFESEVENFVAKGLHLRDKTLKYVLDFQGKIKAFRRKRLSRAELNRWRDRHHMSFWYDIRDYDDQRIKFIENFLQEEVRCGSDIPIAPTPLITSKEMLRIALEINEKSKEVAKSINQICATSFYFPANALSSEQTFDSVVRYITEFDSETPLTVFKFKNLDLTFSNKIAERETYRKLMMDLDDVSRLFPNKAFMILENGKQTFVSSLVGFHIASSRCDGWDMTGSGKASGPYGAWYDPETMTFRPYEKDVLRMFYENGRLLDNCLICNKYKQPPSNSDMWNIDRKLHHIIKRNEENSMIVQDIYHKDILHAVDKLGRSQISILRNTLPY